MKRFFTLCVISALAALFSINAHAYGRWTCVSGDTPQFEGKSATFFIEPYLWDNEGTREEIKRAFDTWSSATGWKMKFYIERGENGGSFGDGIFQVRRGWLYDNPLDPNDHVTAESVALPTFDPGQCHWYDSDIVLSNKYFDDGLYEPSHWTLYSLMLHEIGHAVGMPHNRLLSVVNPAWRDVRGVFGHDIQFARELYGQSPTNLWTNFRTDKVILVNGALSEYYNVLYNYVEASAQVPYTVTNTGKVGMEITVEILYAENKWALGWDSVQVLDSFTVYVEAGSTVSEYTEVPLSAMLISDINYTESTLGFRIVADGDTNPWDDISSIH